MIENVKWFFKLRVERLITWFKLEAMNGEGPVTMEDVMWFFKIRIARFIFWFHRVIKKHFNLSENQQERFNYFFLLHFIRRI